MTKTITAQPITAAAFAPYGDLIEVAGDPFKVINQGRCGRFHDLATLDFADGRAGLSLFQSDIVQFPVRLEMMERHPDGSQAFIPMSQHGFLVVVAADKDGTPSDPQAFVTAAGQAINFHRATWHGVLMPLADPGLFAVIDRIGAGENLQEHWFDDPFIVAPATKPAA